MTTKRSRAVTRLAVLLIALASARPLAAEEKVDLATIHRIKEEAFKHSMVMDHLFYLTDVNGPRLTNSPGSGARSVEAGRYRASS